MMGDRDTGIGRSAISVSNGLPWVLRLHVMVLG